MAQETLGAEGSWLARSGTAAQTETDSAGALRPRHTRNPPTKRTATAHGTKKKQPRAHSEQSVKAEVEEDAMVEKGNEGGKKKPTQAARVIVDAGEVREEGRTWLGTGGGRTQTAGRHSLLSLLEHVSGVDGPLRNEGSCLLQQQQQEEDKMSTDWSRRLWVEPREERSVEREREWSTWDDKCCGGGLTWAFSTESPLLAAFLWAASFSCCCSS